MRGSGARLVTTAIVPDSRFPFPQSLQKSGNSNREVHRLSRFRNHQTACSCLLDREHARFEALGLAPNPIKEFHRDGALMARFFFVQDPDGYKIEVLQRHGRYR